MSMLAEIVVSVLFVGSIVALVVLTVATILGPNSHDEDGWVK